MVIGADGIHSSIRSFIYPQATVLYQGIFTWRTVIHLDQGPQNPIYMMGKETFFLLYPIDGKNNYYVYAHQIREKQEKESFEKEIKNFFDLFKEYGGHVPSVLEKINPKEMVTGFIESVPEVLWGRERVLLVGDAAHACSPGLQQGGAQAIEDAFVWQEEFQKTKTSLDSAIENFKKRRDSRVKDVLTASNMRMKLMSQEGMESRYEAIRKNGPLNRAGFLAIMQDNP